MYGCATISAAEKYVALKRRKIIMAKKVKYSEPAEYFPKEIRKKYGLGEYAEKETPKKEIKKTTKKK